MDILAETIKGFNGFTAQSTINNSAYYNSEEDDTESNPNSDPKVATYTTNGNSPHTLFINRLIPEIIPDAIPPIDQIIKENASGIRETLEARQKILSKEIVMYAVRGGARIFLTRREEIRTGRDKTTPWDRKTAVVAARLTSPVQICHRTIDFPNWTENQDIINPRGPISSQWIRNYN